MLMIDAVQRRPGQVGGTGGILWGASYYQLWNVLSGFGSKVSGFGS